MAHRIKVILSGLGNVGRSFIEIMRSNADVLRERYGLELALVAAADRAGAAYDPQGLDLSALLDLKQARRSVSELAGVGRPGVSAQVLAQGAEADLLLEATPSNFEHGQPGLQVARLALDRGLHVVLASKAPLVLDYPELHALSIMRGVQLRFSAAVGGALPTINVGLRDLAGARITRVEAVLNGTTQMILSAMARGDSFIEGVTEAQRIGIAEADPSLDVDGWDAAAKLVILANVVLHQRAGLQDVARTGIAAVQPADLERAAAAGGRVSLLARAERDAHGHYRLQVAPQVLPGEHPLARLGATEMGLVYESDIYGRTTIISAEQGPGPTAAAMLRDLLEIAGH